LTISFRFRYNSILPFLGEFTDMQQIDDILCEYGRDRGSLIPILHEVQNHFGYLSREAMEAVAGYLGLSAGTVYGVATFYAGFKLAPSGRHRVKACHGTACHVKGASRLIGELEKQLGVKPGETTPDGEYTLETEACFGSCALAPVVVKDGKVYGRVTPARVNGILRGDK
jgi:NADH:ubiquinone oxidoreductase subunit E